MSKVWLFLERPTFLQTRGLRGTSSNLRIRIKQIKTKYPTFAMQVSAYYNYVHMLIFLETAKKVWIS